MTLRKADPTWNKRESDKQSRKDDQRKTETAMQHQITDQADQQRQGIGDSETPEVSLTDAAIETGFPPQAPIFRVHRSGDEFMLRDIQYLTDIRDHGDIGIAFGHLPLGDGGFTDGQLLGKLPLRQAVFQPLFPDKGPKDAFVDHIDHLRTKQYHIDLRLSRECWSSRAILPKNRGRTRFRLPNDGFCRKMKSTTEELPKEGRT